MPAPPIRDPAYPDPDGHFSAVDTLSEQTLSAIKLGAQQLADVVTLPAQQRYARFVQQVAETGEVWGLYRDGWALAKTDDGTLVFAMWPASEFADLCAEYEWDRL